MLGFESMSGWQGPGAKQLSTERTQGAHSLALSPTNYSRYTSAPIELEGELRGVALDLKLPSPQPNPYWYGATQLYATCAEKNVYSAYLGQVELTGRPLGSFTTLELTTPSHVRAALGSGCRALQLDLVLNVPGSPGKYLVDNLRLRTDLLVLYELEEDTARVTDTSGYDHHAQLLGGAAIVTDEVRGAVLRLDGSSGYVELPATVLSSASDVTVATWVKLDQLGAWTRIFDFGGPNGFLFLTPSTHDGLLRYSAYTAADREGIVTAPALPVGVWKHVAVTARGLEYRLYVDGVEAGAALGVPVTPAQIGSNTEQWLGRSRFPADPFLDGAIDDFRIYDRALSQPEIAALARPQAGYAHYGFEEASGSVVRDSSELGLHGTLVGAAAREPGIIGRALRLSGGHVRLPGDVVSECSDFTFAAWAKLRSNRPWNRVFDFGMPDLTHFMYLSPAGVGAAGPELRFGLVAPGGVHDLGFPFAAPLEEWMHLGVVVQEQSATLFLNGRPAASRDDVVVNPSDLGAALESTLGKSSFPDPTFDGALDDVRFSCRAYDARELGQLSHPPLPATPPRQRQLSGALTDVHDPALIAAGGGYYLFSTGPGLLTRFSPDLSSFTFTGQVFAENPAWVSERFGALDALWAPDISFFGGQYHLYYSASTFGSNRSCIGHATKANLASSAPWVDHGPVICSNFESVDDFNAIDPNVIVDVSGAPWLSFGSFWGGLQLIPLDASGARLGSAIHNIAKGPGTAVEAPFIVYRAPYYYLFASVDFCCRGVNSTYRQVVGRSTSVTGPYLDRSGLPMLQAGGTHVVAGSSRFRGPGHNAVIATLGQTFNVYHAYDASNNGVPTLRISELAWHDGWPVNAEP